MSAQSPIISCSRSPREPLMAVGRVCHHGPNLDVALWLPMPHQIHEIDRSVGHDLSPVHEHIWNIGICPVSSAPPFGKGKAEGFHRQSIKTVPQLRIIFDLFDQLHAKSSFGLFVLSIIPEIRPQCKMCPYSFMIVPSVEMTTTCHGINLPLACNAAFAACSNPPQQGTSIRTIVTL